MSQSKSTSYTFFFAFTVCVVCSLILSLAATALKEKQVANVKLDIVQNLMSAVEGDIDTIRKKPTDAIFEEFHKNYEALLLNSKDQVVTDDFMIEELLKVGYERADLEAEDTGTLLRMFNSRVGLLARRSDKKLEDYDPGLKLLYLYKPGGVLKSYVVPIEGYGLWDIIKGYIALDSSDVNTVKGVSFYEHHETPGLGARITEAWFREQWKDKKIFDDDGELVSIKVAKGKAENEVSPAQLPHYVDGISGATLTGKGINFFLKRDLERYKDYFHKIRNQNASASTQKGARG